MRNSGIANVYLYLGVGFALGLAGLRCQPEAAPYPPRGVDARHYDVSLRLDPATRYVEARVTIEIQRSDSLTRLPLLFDGMMLDSAFVDGAPADLNREGQRLVVSLPGGQTTSRLSFVYHGTPATGLYTARHEGQAVTFTDAWPDEGRGWLPGIHHPADPATWTLTLTVPVGHEAAASGTLVRLDTLADAVQYQWHLGMPAPLYTLAFAVSDFTTTEVVVGDTLPVRYTMLAADAAQATHLRRTPEALNFFSELIGPYPYEHYEAVQVPIRYAGMENASAAFLQASLFDDPALVERVQVHELAHQWFGNRVPIAAWRDLWLSEGTATYLTSLFYAHADGPDAARQRWIEGTAWTAQRQRTHQALVPEPGTRPEALLSWVPYQKGASVLHLLRLKVGDAAFTRALRAAYALPPGEALSTDAFQAILGREGQGDLDDFFAYWVYGSAVPILRTDWDAATRTLTWTIDQDDGTLAGIPFELQVRQGARVQYVDATPRRVVLGGWDGTRPEVRPVGVLLQVR